MLLPAPAPAPAPAEPAAPAQLLLPYPLRLLASEGGDQRALQPSLRRRPSRLPPSGEQLSLLDYLAARSPLHLARALLADLPTAAPAARPAARTALDAAVRAALLSLPAEDPARRRLLEEVLAVLLDPLLQSEARRLAPAGDEAALADLCQEARLIAWEALTSPRYDPRQTSLRAYLVGALRRGLPRPLNRGRLIYVPERQMSRVCQLRRLVGRAEAARLRPAEIASLLGISLEMAANTRTALDALSLHSASLPAQGEEPPRDLLRSHASRPRAEEVLLQRDEDLQRFARLQAALDTLPELHRAVLLARTPLDGSASRTLAQAARHLGLSIPRARSLASEAAALLRLALAEASS